MKILHRQEKNTIIINWHRMKKKKEKKKSWNKDVQCSKRQMGTE
jgi:hypothetical protein